MPHAEAQQHSCLQQHETGMDALKAAQCHYVLRGWVPYLAVSEVTVMFLEKAAVFWCLCQCECNDTHMNDRA